jgi:hypothetical protein
MAKLPPGISAESLATALKKFADIVGPDWVFHSDEDVALYRDAYSPLWNQPGELVASAAVAPASVEQVQAIVCVANEYKLPLYPISTGKNLGYGGSAPNMSGSIVVDLKRMNRVLEVDDKRHYALVEPGVAYYDLYRHIQDHKLRVWMDCPDPGWGSVMGNALDHGVGSTGPAFRNHWAAHCGLEVVLPNGELMRTGMGAMPGAKNWQDHQFGFGPSVDGLFAQGNFGIVTKMGIWLMPAPEAFASGTITVKKHDDLIPLIEVVNYLENLGITNGLPDFGFGLGPMFIGGPAQPSGAPTTPKPDGSVDIAALDRYADEKQLPFWTVTLHFYGPAKVIAAQWEYAKSRFAQIPGSKAIDGAAFNLPLTSENLEKSRTTRQLFGEPDLSIFSLAARNPFTPTPGSGLMWFAPLVPRTGEAVLEAQKTLWRIGEEVGMACPRWLLPKSYFQRSFVVIVPVVITRDPAVDGKHVQAYRDFVRIAGEHGYGEYRAHALIQDNVMDAYSFGDHALRRFCERLKEGVDPNGIMAPGRSGIWSKRYPRSQA